MRDRERERKRKGEKEKERERERERNQHETSVTKVRHKVNRLISRDLLANLKIKILGQRERECNPIIHFSNIAIVFLFANPFKNVKE